jgi:hypothetical protein
MDTSQPPASWTCNFQLGDASPGIKTTNLKVVPDKTPKSDLLLEGGIW